MPMSCAMHDVLEAAAVRGWSCRVVHVDEHGDEHVIVAVPLDWWVEIGVEWGRFRRADGGEVVLNLSDIASIEPAQPDASSPG